MAESQERYPYSEFSGAKLKAEWIEVSLSKERFLPYFNSAGHDYERVYHLYLYNARLSKAFLFPLHVLEVALRNSMSMVFSIAFGFEWHINHHFENMLTAKGKDSLSKILQKTNSEDLDDFIAESSFEFWTYLLAPCYSAFWHTNLTKLVSSGLSRGTLFEKVKQLNQLRNRIAHHEPIYAKSCSNLHADIGLILKGLNPEAFNWVKAHSTVDIILRTKPDGNGGAQPLIKSRMDSDFIEVKSTLSLNQFPQQRFIICSDKEIVITHENLGWYFLSLSEDNELVIDLNNYCLKDLIRALSLKKNYIVLNELESFSYTKKVFQKKKHRFIVVTHHQTASVMGVIAQPHRQF